MGQTLSTLRLELEKRCLDLATVKRPAARYDSALNWALAQYPLALWQLNVDGTTLDTVEDQREYALYGVGGIPAITTIEQVRRIWIDDSDGVPRETGRWEVREDDGDLTLVLDEPPDGAYDITIEYYTPPPTMGYDGDATDCDDEWLLAKAMIDLMGEADWGIEDPQRILAQLEFWNARATLRERRLLGERKRAGRRPRTTAWRQYVT